MKAPTTGRPNYRAAARGAALRGTAAPRAVSREEQAAWYPANWAEISEAVRRRDGYRCCISRLHPERVCRAYLPPPFSGYLHCHHIVPLPRGSNRGRNLITLCSDCHSFMHGRNVGHVPDRVKARY